MCERIQQSGGNSAVPNPISFTLNRSKAGIPGRRGTHALGIPYVHSIHGASFHFGQPAVLHHSNRVAEKLAIGWCQHFVTV